jgi:hypothetical protein
VCVFPPPPFCLKEAERKEKAARVRPQFNGPRSRGGWNNDAVQLKRKDPKDGPDSNLTARNCPYDFTLFTLRLVPRKSLTVRECGEGKRLADDRGRHGRSGFRSFL